MKTQRTFRPRAVLVALVVATGSGCTAALSPEDPLFVGVTEIEVTGVTDVQPFSDRLDVEIHIFDAVTDRFLGCSGEDSGLRDVDYSDITYFVSGYFQTPPSGQTSLTVDAVIGRDVYLVVIEDDEEPCPVVTNEGSLGLSVDDLIGVSPILYGEELADGVVLSFDQVVHLVMEPLR